MKEGVLMGEKVKRSIFKRWWFWVIVIIILIGTRAAGSNDNNQAKDTDNSKSVAADTTKKEETKKEETKKEEPKKEDSKVTYENFLKVKMNDKLETIVSLLGEGQELSSSEVAGIKTVMYSWYGSGISTMNVTIQNGVVTGKAQMALKDFDAGVTMEKYNQVKEGMTYDKVKAILGDGQITSQTKLLNMETIMYSWVNKDGSNCTGIFTAGKLDMKAQFNLK
jgi:hypothetical protein